MSTIDAGTLSAWLQKKSDAQGKPLKLLFTTMPGGTFSKNASSIDTLNKVIPGSLYFDFQDAFADSTSSLSNTMCSAEQFEKEARKMGFNNDDTLVVYDNYGNFCASRVWFMCKSMGCQDVYVLDGGLAKWMSLSLPVQSVTSLNAMNKKANNENAKGNFTAKPDAHFQFVGLETLIPIAKNNNKNTKSVIIDARGPKRFTGEAPDPRPNVRSGHIPNSINLHYAKLQNDWGEFLCNDKLGRLFEKAVCIDDSFVFSCGSGVTACIVAQAAFMLGIAPLQVYDGSWSQWGALPELPIQTSI